MTKHTIMELFASFTETSLEEPILKKARLICADFLGGAWTRINNTQYTLEKISGGLTNLMFLCRLSPSIASIGTEPREALLRIQSQTDTLQLMNEVAVFTKLAESGYGPQLYGIFPGGRIEEYIPSRMLTYEELRQPRFTSQFASLLARVNNLPMPLSKAPQIITTMREWIERYERNGGGPIQLSCSTIQISSDVYPSLITINDLIKELLTIEEFLSNSESPTVFCHNDTCASNILLKNSKFNSVTMQTDGREDHEQNKTNTDDLVLIDFEFCCYNYRGFEIANHMSEYGMEFGLKEYPYYKMFPSRMMDEKLRGTLCQGYLQEIYKINCSPSILSSQGLSGNKESDLRILNKEAIEFLPIVNFYWGIWSLLCDQELQAPEVAFAVNACDRIILYFSLKSNMPSLH